MKLSSKKIALSAAALIATAATANAATLTPAAGLDLRKEANQANALQVYSEQAGVTVASNSVTTDYLVGTNLSVGQTANGITNFSSGQSLTGGTYDSYLVQFDPGEGGSITNVSFDFGSSIVGIILSNNGTNSLLNAADSIFGTAAFYESGVGRRSEKSDTFTLTNASTLSFTFKTGGGYIDNIRVLTEVASVPVPASALLLGGAMGGFGFMRRRKA